MAAPFQCERCHFINIHKRLPLDISSSDQSKLAYLKRANLDMFWSRRPGTLDGLVRGVMFIVKTSQVLALPGVLPDITPWPVKDEVGMALAIVLLRKSISVNSGNSNSKTHLQFDTVRKLRTVYSDIFEATCAGNQDNKVMKKGSETMHYHDGVTQSRFFERFTLGMKTRMGQVSKRNQPITSDMVVAMLVCLENKLRSVPSNDDQVRYLIMTGSLIVILFCGSLRGHEGFMLDADSLAKNISVGIKTTNGKSFILVPLYGYFKGENGERMHVIPLTEVTRSGIKVRFWLELHVALLERENKLGREGPAFCDLNGEILKPRVLESRILNLLLEVQSSDMNEDESIISKSLDVYEKFGIYRSFRRGATCMAADRNVSELSIALVNRWRKFENGRGRVPNMSMMEHYLSNLGAFRKALSFSESL